MGCIWRIWARKRCSRWTMRSKTSSNEAGGGADTGPPALGPAGVASVVAAGGGEDVGFCETAGNDQTNHRKNESKPAWKIRIQNPSGNKLRHLKNDVQNDGRIGRLPILHCWLELNLFGGLDGVIVETVTQSADHAHDTEFARGLQDHFQQDLALNPQIPSFLSIDGSWLGKNFRRQNLGGSFRGTRVDGGRRGHIGTGEAGRLNRARGPRAGVRNCCAIAKAGAYDHAGHAFGATGSVPVAWAGGEIERSERRDIDGLALIRFSRNSIGVAETSGLHLGGGARQRGSGRTPGGKHVRLYRLLWNPGCGCGRQRLQFTGGDGDRRSRIGFNLHWSLRQGRGQPQGVGWRVQPGNDYGLLQLM